MSFNKAKALKTASKYVQGGKYQSAIEEYRQIAQADPSDVTTLNTLGDLFVKVGQTGEAIASFVHIAEHYRVSGFYLKSIAMLKKVSKLDPGNIDVSLKLATLYAQQKLIVDARHQYLSVAEHYIREGQTKQALEIYQRIADLDPENTAVQIKLAEAFLRENQIDKAYDTFVIAAGEMRRQNKDGEALQTYLRAVRAQPQSQSALASAVNLYLERKESQLAIDLLEELLTERPNDAELLTLLARIYQATQNLEAAETAIDKMLYNARSRYQYGLDLSHLYVQQHDVTGALRVFDRVVEILCEYREEEKAAQLLRNVLALEGQHVGTLTRLAAIYERTHDDHLLVETLNLLTDAAMQGGNESVAISTLQRLLELEPDEIQHRRRLCQLVGEEVESYGDSPRTENYQSDYSSEVGQDFWEQAEAEDANIRHEQSAEESTSFSVPDSAVNVVTEEEEMWGEVATDAAPATNGYQPDAQVEFAPSNTNFFESTIIEPSATSAGTGQETFEVMEGSAPSTNLRDELESVDFYLYQGMLDVARYTLESIATQFPNAPEVKEKLAELEAAESATAQTILTAESSSETAEENTFAFAPTNPEVEPPQVAETLTFPVSLNLQDVEMGYIVTPVQEAEASPKTEKSTAFLLQSEHLAQIDLAAPSFSGIPEHPVTAPMVMPVTEAEAQTQSTANSFDLFEGDEMGELLDFLDEFKAETDQHKPHEDFDTHYNLGQAYKEMDMFEEAIEEFQQAFKAIMNDPMHRDYVSCCSMLAFCFMQKALPRLAAVWLKKGLESPGRGEDVYHALRYDLADAYAALGDFKDAYNMFAEIYAVDVQYRGVKTRMQEIAAQMKG